MELKFRLFSLVLLLALFGCIESKKSGGGRRTGGSGGGKHTSGGGGGWFSRKTPTRAPPSSHPVSRPNYHATDFHHREATHTTNTGRNNNPLHDPYHGASAPPLINHGSSSPIRPFGTVPPSGINSNNNNKPSPIRPFGTVPPSGVTSNNNNKPSPIRPFGTVPPSGVNSNNNNKPSPIRPFGTVPPSRVNNTPKPASPQGPGTFPDIHHRQTPSVPGHHVYPTQPPVNPHINRPIHRPPYSRNSTFGSPSHVPGSYGSMNRTIPGFPSPSVPGIQQTRYHGLQSGNSGATYPRQPPPYTPYPGQQPPPYTPYPGHQPPPYTPYPGHQPPPYTPYPGHQPPLYSSHPVHYPNSGHTPGVQINNYHPLPPNPAQTVVIVPGGGSSYASRTTGDIFKEAIIHAGVNAAVNRIVNRDSFGHSYGHSYSSSLPIGQSTVTNTNTHTVTNNYYGQPLDANGPAVPPAYNGQPSLGGVPGGVLNTVNNPGNYGGSGTQGSAGSGGAGVPVAPSNGQSLSAGNNRHTEANWVQGVSDQELKNITEQLFRIDENNGAKFITLNLQSKIAGNNTNISDTSFNSLFSVDQAAYRIPTVKGIRSLYEAIAAVENKTQENSRKEETLFVDLVLNTNVMTTAMDFLSRKKLVTNDYYEHKDVLNHIWFTPYEENSSGFKRVFQGELLEEDILWGLQDWTAFDYQEKAGRANYLSYVEKLDLKSSPNIAILKANFDIGRARKVGTALFIGISPELQMALYTICNFARPNNYCDVSLGGNNVRLFTHTFRYFGQDLIDAAFPIF